MQPPLHPALFHSNSQDAHCTPVCLSLVSSTRGHFIFNYTPNTLSSFFLLVSFSRNEGSAGSGFFLNYLSYMPFHVSSYKHLSFVPRSSLSLSALFYCWILIPTLGPSIFSLSLACATLTLFLLTCHSGIRAITTVPHRPAAKKKNNFQPLFLSQWARQAHPWPSCITLF